MIITERIKKELEDNADLKYLDFHSKLIPNINNIKGVRVPVLRKIAKSISIEKDVFAYLNSPISDSYEEITIYGLVIGYLKLDVEKYQSYLEKFISLIDNWATCDIAVSNMKFIKKYKKEMYSFIIKYLNSNKEFEVRFSIVVLMNYYLDDEFEETLKLVDHVTLDCYYVKMAIAWLVSICYIKHKDGTLKYLNDCNLDDWTYNKALQKIIESKRVSDNEKINIKKLKRK